MMTPLHVLLALRVEFEKEHRELSATRMLGPYRVLSTDRSGDFVVTSNGHPISSCHPWRRSLYFPRGADGSRNRRRGVCPAAMLKPCLPACVLCGIGFVPPGVTPSLASMQ